MRHTEGQDGVEALDFAENGLGVGHPDGIGSIGRGPVLSEDSVYLLVHSILIKINAKVTKPQGRQCKGEQ